MDEVLKYYSEYDEDIRLKKTRLHKIEFLTTTRYLDKILNPNSEILDLCAGTGAYSFYLEGRRHSVTAVDIVPRFVDIMREKKKDLSSNIDVHEGDARDLSMFRPNHFDVVLCMGAFYHLKQESDRRKAIEQSISVLKDNGILVVSYINRNAVFNIEFNKVKEVVDRAVLEELLNTGCKLKDQDDPFYCSTPQEIENLMKEFNVEKITNIATDGISYLLGEKIMNLSEEDYQFWLDTHYKTCENENLIGYSLHGLYFGRKSNRLIRK